MWQGTVAPARRQREQGRGAAAGEGVVAAFEIAPKTSAF